MAEHSSSVIVYAPVRQVYALFTHFNDFPKFMRFIKEVTYYDDNRSHWVVQALGRYEWDAVNEDWIPDQQIGWRSTSGLKNTGRVKFRALGANRTEVDVYISYSPPSGALGAIGENLGIDNYFDALLQQELHHFARMVEEAPAGALDPMSSHYLFHENSAVARKDVTERQSAAMASDPMMSEQALAERQAKIEQEKTQRQQVESERAETQRHLVELERAAAQELKARLEQVAARRRQEEQQAREAQLAAAEARPVPDPVYNTLGGRNASLDRTAFGDKDALRPRHLNHLQDPMISRNPSKKQKTTQHLDMAEAAEEAKLESPWFLSIRGSLPSSEESSSTEQ
jgi:hypothetical protein